MICTINFSKAYSEVYSFINTLGKDYINKIPIKIYNTIKDNRDINYNPQFDKNQTIKHGMISQEALSLIAALNLQYWCKDVQEKNDLKSTYLNNTKKEEEKYSYDNLFNNKITNNENINVDDINNIQNENSKSLIEYKESIFKKILNKIKRFFRFIK